MFTHNLQDYMMDHEMTAQVARACSFGYAVPNACPGPIAKGAGVPHLYYADPVEGVDYYGKLIEPTTFVDITARMATKIRMLKAHACMGVADGASTGWTITLGRCRRGANGAGCRPG